MEARLNRACLRRAARCFVGLVLAATAAPANGQYLPPAVGSVPVSPHGGVAPTLGGPRAAVVSAPSMGPGRTQPRQKAVAQSQNFIVFADHPEWAQEVAQVAEQLRSDLAVYWLGRELPAWPQRCPLHVNDAENLGAGGETRFALQRGVPGNWMMSVQGTRQRILDSVLPHEITHTIFATHFGRTGKYVPRWADEGACTTVEHEAEKRKHRHFLQQFLKTGRGLAFNEMFRLKEYPQDILPLYAQGHSAVQFLLDQAGPRHFIQFLEMGMQTENWPASLQRYYGYPSIGDFQVSWNRWLVDGSPADLTAYAPLLRSQTPDQSIDSALADKKPSPQPSAASNSPKAESLAMTNSDSWYKRRLHETSGSPATTIPPHNHFAGDPAGTLQSNLSIADSRTKTPGNTAPTQTLIQDQGPQPRSAPLVNARPQPYQTPQIQVLEWGPHQPIPSQMAVPQSYSPILR